MFSTAWRVSAAEVPSGGRTEREEALIFPKTGVTTEYDLLLMPGNSHPHPQVSRGADVPVTFPRRNHTNCHLEN